MCNSFQLTKRQSDFVDFYALLGNASEAARRAGYSERTARVIGPENLRKPAIAAAVAARQAEYAAELQITKQDVVNGILGAIGMARDQKNPAVMIAGCVQLGKLLGFYGPECHKVESVPDVAAMQARFAAMSDAELYALAAGSRGRFPC